MPSHATMWMVAGGSALLSAALTFAVTRPSIARATERVRDGLHALTGPLAPRFARSGENEGGAEGGAGAASAGPQGSHNRAFEEYRMAALGQLEQEEAEFREYLERLRLARDRAEFDDFVRERKSRPASGA